jgi:hypothetical protein
MALFNYEDLKKLSTSLNENNNLDMKIVTSMEKSENISLEEMDSIELKNCDIYGNFDIFLSHSYQDKEIIPALKIKLEDMGYSVYVDWISDGCISRNKTIDKETASMLQKRMKQSKCLLYATSSNSKNSRWMPWELGYFDGIKNKKVAILPISKSDNDFDNNFKGEEYLGLYQYIDNTNDTLYVQENSSTYESFKDWINK